MTNRSRTAIALAVAAGALTSAANAGVILTYTYHDLAGSYAASSADTGMFTAIAVNQNGGLRSAGEVSRTDSNPGSASFEVGFPGGGTMAAFSMTCSFTRDGTFPGILGSGVGSFTATDADGDTITGDVIGTWLFDAVNNFIYLNASLANVLVSDNGNQDDEFNGSQLGDFQISGLGNAPFEGALTQITFGAGNFFFADFQDKATGLTAQILPAPGSLALLGLGGLVAARRRR
ncbi:MAG: hypothetical protein JNK25_02105 [Phycisphaerae bacterium]|nr:hypothetical protein [Phycisphaerae bacterium]